MAKKKSWFGWLKKLFVCNQDNKRANSWRWNLGRLEVRQYPPALTASERTLSEASEEQKKHALNVAMATAAAAEAAIAAAEAAAKVLCLTGGSGHCKWLGKLDPNAAATKIQSAYRAHLARKALRALKGLVRLQAIARGRAVRRRTSAILKRLRAERKARGRAQHYKGGEKKTIFEPKKDFEEHELKFECDHQGEWNCNSLSKEDIEIIWLKRQEAAMKRERMKKYSFSHRERRNSTFTLHDSFSKDFGAQSCRLEPREGHEARSGRISTEARGKAQKSTITTEFPLLRKSFSHEKWDPFGDDGLMPGSPAYPAYMAATESAKAKTRSTSIPKQRVGFWDGCLNRNHPNNRRLSLWSSYDGESFWPN